MLRTRDSIRLGVQPRTLYKLLDCGELEQVGRGICRLSTASPLTNPDMVSVAMRTSPACGGSGAAQPHANPKARWHSATHILVLRSVIQRRDRRRFESSFRHRGTTIDATPVGLAEAFRADPARAEQWRVLVRPSGFESGSALLEELAAQMRCFASAPLMATAR
jgi:hypothetical protein